MFMDNNLQSKKILWKNKIGRSNAPTLLFHICKTFQLLVVVVAICAV